jgi:hypothetical protein
MQRYIILAVTAVALCPVLPARASGPVGVYAIVEKVVFEPSESAAERVQVWGAFAYAEIGGTPGSSGVSAARRGYLYFRLPDVVPGFNESVIAAVRREWADLKAVSGTGQAVAFGRWSYFGNFESGPLVLDRDPQAAESLLVRPAWQPPATAGTYRTNAGIVKLTGSSHAAVIKQLRDALQR